VFKDEMPIKHVRISYKSEILKDCKDLSVEKEKKNKIKDFFEIILSSDW
jgi:hypothetical protein